MDSWDSVRVLNFWHKKKASQLTLRELSCKTALLIMLSMTCRVQALHAIHIVPVTEVQGTLHFKFQQKMKTFLASSPDTKPTVPDLDICPKMHVLLYMVQTHDKRQTQQFCISTLTACAAHHETISNWVRDMVVTVGIDMTHYMLHSKYQASVTVQHCIGVPPNDII